MAAGYAAVLVAEALTSWLAAPTYRFNGEAWLLLAGGIGAVMAWQWWGRPIPRSAWWYAGALVAVALLTAVHTSRDPLRYLFDGYLLVREHLSPYTTLPYELPLNQYSQLFDGIWWTAIPSPYGPLWQALMGAVNLVTGNTLAGGLVALKLLNLSALILSARYLYLITRQAWPAWLLIVNPVILANTLATPHTDVIMLALVLGGVYHRRLMVRAVLLAGAALIKPHALLLVPVVARTWAERLKLVGAVALAIGGWLLLLWPVTRYEQGPMLGAAFGGGLAAADSLLLGSPASSLILFAGTYLAVIWLYLAHKLSDWTALAAVALLVPLTLTGLLLPWHFIIPIGLLLLVKQRWSLYIVMLLTALAMRSALRVSELLLIAALVAGGVLVVKYALRLKSN